MANCPFCSSVLLRHVRASQMYWFCRRCRTEILKLNGNQAISLSISLDRLLDGSQSDVKLNESPPFPLTVHKD